ncbi:MAG: undecaprenyl-phosphate glucose phosphotransferase [Lachnospiraceae bacterium]|nr:undecaprenyl-phosphate glucose phosphotransferase [Lachnospiraceae bacterium]
MIEENQKLFNRIQVVLDVLILLGTYALAWFVRFRSGLVPIDDWYLSLDYYMRLLIYIVPGYLILYYIFQLYTPKRIQGRRLVAWRIIQANVIGMMALSLYLYVTAQGDISRIMLFIFFCLNIFMEILVRNIIRFALRSIRKRGYNQKHIILVGYSRATEQYIDRILNNPEWGYSIRGILDDHQPRGFMYRGIKVIGSIDNLLIILPQNRVDEIAIAMGLNEYHKLEYIVGLCEKSGVHTKFIPDYNNIIPTRPYTEDLQGLPVINIRHVPLSNGFNKFMKRVVDLFGATVALLLFSPMMFICAILIKLTSPGPLIYKQVRVGYANRNFAMYKFRSMVVQEDTDEKKEWTTKNDPRVTKIGKFIRQMSIDELPQLFNVFKGDMSMVGPRPERPQFVEKFMEEIPRYNVKHQVRPGLTGFAQVNGLRGDTSIYERIDCDLYYIEHWTLGFDFKIIFLTFFRGFVNKNAY